MALLYQSQTKLTYSLKSNNLFDTISTMEKTFNEKLEELITKKASDFEVSKLFKEEIGLYLGSLDKKYDKDKGHSFLVSHTKNIEKFIVDIYKYVLRESFLDYMPPVNSIPVAFVALGSFGREQLCIYSDLDIMIAYKDVKGFDIKPLMERVLYLAWDAGLKIGHRVHELEEIEDAAKSDDTIKTAMLEGRFFFGSKFLWMEIENKIARIRKTERDMFIKAKLLENTARLKKYPLSNEPSIKDGYGALREDNTLLWILKSQYNIRYIKDLSHSLIDEEEYKEFRMALEFLFRLRIAMHLVAKRKKDILTFDIQRDVAKKLGFSDTKRKTAESTLLKKTLHSLIVIHSFSAYYISLFTDTPVCEKMDKISKSLYLHDDRLYYDGKEKADLKEFLDAFLLLDDDVEFHESMLGYFRRVEIPDKLNFRIKRVMLKLFSKKKIFPLLLCLYESGVLAEIFVLFKRVTNLAQFDGYHRYPVDKHSVLTVKYLENIKDEDVFDVYDALEKNEKELLKLVGLFHDIGKGRTSDHREIGSRIFKSYARQLGLKEPDAERGARLILHHTLMSNTALREDILSEKVILNFVSLVDDKKTLDMLYVLTYADISAVGSGAYTAFNADLIKELYRNSLLMIDKKELVGEAVKRKTKEKRLKQNRIFQELSDVSKKKILQIESNLFFIKFSPQEIVDIAKMALCDDEYIFKTQSPGRFIVHLVSKKKFNLGWFLSKFVHIDLVSMDIFRLFDKAKYFRMEFNTTIDDSSEHIKYLIEEAFDMQKKIIYKKPAIKKEEIEINCGHSLTYGKMTLKCKNQKGLMASVIEVFDTLKIDIAIAKISTVKNITRDLFLIEKSEHFCKKSKKIVSMLTDEEK